MRIENLIPQPTNAEAHRLAQDRSLVPARPAKVPATTGIEDAGATGSAGSGVSLAGPAPGLDVRNLSPRGMADLSMDLYMAGVLAYDDYAQLAFQPELHPDYDQTIGALTGKKAEPDRPRDFITEWEEKLVFERGHNSDPERVNRTQRILTVLKRIAAPTDVVA
ncbi:MAG: hypothetical protein H6907_20505 [Hyphomicrobiales bacterium]|nr:hypothetical protein [Hyphomicrobiales bacterium]MCP5374124.1 hypothetical protein [Hyphomicrobiales bacterium]